MNRDMLRNGILLLSFSTILLAIKQTRETPILGTMIPPPTCFSTALRWALIVILLIVVFVFFWIWHKYKLANLLKKWIKKVVYVITILILFFILWLISTIPAIPVYLFTALGIIALLTSLVFMVAVFRERLALKLNQFIEEQQFHYWQIYWLVYIGGWLRGLISIPKEGLVFTIAYWLVYSIGLAWFLVIPLIMLRAPRQRGKRI